MLLFCSKEGSQSTLILCFRKIALFTASGYQVGICRIAFEL